MAHTKVGVRTRGDPHSIGIPKLARPKSTEYPICGQRPAAQGRRRIGALEMERNIDRNKSSKPRAVQGVRTFGRLIDPHEKIDPGLLTAPTGHTDAWLKRRISVADIASVFETSTIRSTEYPTSRP